MITRIASRRAARFLLGTGLVAGLSFSAASAFAAPSGPGAIGLPSTTVTTAEPPCDPKLASCDLTSATTTPKPCPKPSDCFTSPTPKPDDPGGDDPGTSDPDPGGQDDSTDPQGSNQVAPASVDAPVRANPSFTG